jgi:hypothetical protein
MTMQNLSQYSEQSQEGVQNMTKAQMQVNESAMSDSDSDEEVSHPWLRLTSSQDRSSTWNRESRSFSSRVTSNATA